jgi:hypothetical protein
MLNEGTVIAEVIMTVVLKPYPLPKVSAVRASDVKVSDVKVGDVKRMACLTSRFSKRSKRAGRVVRFQEWHHTPLEAVLSLSKNREVHAFPSHWGRQKNGSADPNQEGAAATWTVMTSGSPRR